MQKRAPTRRVSYNPVITLLEMNGNGRWSQDGNGPLKASNLHLIADSRFCRRREPQPAQPRTAEDASAVNSARGDTMHTASRIEDLGVELSNWCQLTVVQVAANQSKQVNTNVSEGKTMACRKVDLIGWKTSISSHGGLPKGLWIGAYKNSWKNVLYPSKCASIDQYVSRK
jgi:hypothetical protein